MKQLYTLLLLSICLIVSSCEKKDQRILNSLDGTWRIKRVTHLEQDTTKIPGSGTITFSKCELGKGNCPGTYTFDGQQMSDSNWNVSEKGKEVGIFTSSQLSTYNFSDTYKVVQRSDNRLELEGNIIVLRKLAGQTTKVIKVSILLER